MAATRDKTKRGGKVKRTRTPPPEPTAALPVRITGDLIDRVDAIRPDMIPREPFIRHLLDLQLTQMEEEG